MAQTAANVLVGMPLVTGPIAISHELIQLEDYPDDASTEIAGLEAVGYIGEDGVTESNGRSTDKIRAWGGDTVRTVQTEHDLTYTFAFLESKNATVLKAVYGPENVEVTEGVSPEDRRIVIKKNAKTLPHMSFDMRMLDGDTKIRNFVPDGQITEVGDITYVHSDVIRYEVTVEAYADANGDKAIQVMDG